MFFYLQFAHYINVYILNKREYKIEINCRHKHFLNTFCFLYMQLVISNVDNQLSVYLLKSTKYYVDSVMVFYITIAISHP